MASGCYVGAIRWDAWYAPTGPAVSTRRSLGPEQYQGRAPFFAQRLSTNAIDLLPTQETMTQEINFALQGGLSYWCWLLYEPTSEMMYGYDLYQANPNKNLLKWCQMRSDGMWGSTNNYSTQVTDAVNMCLQPNYFKLSGNRPLVYIYYGGDTLGYWGGSIVEFKKAIDAFRAQCISAGLGNPYIALTTSSDAARVGLGAEALTGYISGFSYQAPLPTSYSKLDTDTRAYWETLKTNSTGEVIPICMAGWGAAPRKERPVTWGIPSQKPHFGASLIFQQPSNAELAAHFQAAVDWVNANPTDCPTRCILTYAWNENDEGGWLIPTLEDPTGSRLTAIRPVIEF